MKRNAMLLIYLLMTVSGFSQIGYPKKILLPNNYGGYDTVVAITTHQMDIINSVKIDYDGCVEINDTMTVLIDSCKSAFVLMNRTDSILKREIVLKDLYIIDRNNVISNMEKVIEHHEKRITRLKWRSGVVNGILTAVIAYIVIFK